MVLAYVSGSDVLSASTFLRRVAVPGHGGWNVMEADLGMEKDKVLKFLEGEDAYLGAQKLQLSDRCSLSAEGVLTLKDDQDRTLTLSGKGITFTGKGETESQDGFCQLDLVEGLVLRSAEGGDEAKTLLKPGSLKIQTPSEDGDHLEFSMDRTVFDGFSVQRFSQADEEASSYGMFGDQEIEVYDLGTKDLFGYNSEGIKNANIKQGIFGSMSFPQFHVQKASSRWFSVNFNNANDRIELVDTDKSKIFLVGLSHWQPYGGSIPFKSTSDQSFLNQKMEIISKANLTETQGGTPYLYLGDDRKGAGDDPYSDLLITPESFVRTIDWRSSNNYYNNTYHKTWQDLGTSGPW